MSVKDPNKAYVSMEDKWRRCRDVSAGKDSMYEAGERYLPKLSDQSNVEYDAYRGRTPFFNATWRTISGLQGMLFRQPPNVVVPDTVVPMLQDITMSCEPFHIFTLELTEEILTVGRVGIFVDYPPVDTTNLTLADAQRLNLRPTMASYTAETIINWKMSIINNASVLSQVVLVEVVDDQGEDEFTVTEKTQYRVLDLTPIQTPTGETRYIYRVRVFEVKEKDGTQVDTLTEGPIFPIINGDFVEFIPFYFVSVDDVDCDIDLPPLLDLIDMNISHYQSTADYEHGCHFTGLPTAVITGYVPESSTAKFGIGSMTAWIFPRPDAKAFYLEFTGQGLDCLKVNIAGKEQKMAVLGARMLEAQASGTESADTAGIHRSGEQSTLASIAQAVSMGVKQALKTFCLFSGIEDTSVVDFDLNRDFFPPQIDALTLTALIAGWQNGAYGYESLFNMLKQAEIVKQEQDVDSEIASMAKHPPVIPGGTQVNQEGTSKNPTQTSSKMDNPTVRELQTPP